MQVGTVLDARAWAKREFGRVDLGDARRAQRLVAMASQVMRHPNASLPAQLQAPKALKAAYRLLAEEDVSHRAVMTPHWEGTDRQRGRPGLPAPQRSGGGAVVAAGVGVGV